MKEARLGECTDNGDKPEERSGRAGKVKIYLRKIGLAGVIFFTVKGIISTSLIVAAVLAGKSCF